MSQENPALTMIRDFVAVGRGELARPHTPEGDPDAQRAITRGITVLDPEGGVVEVAGPLLELLEPRAPYFDGLVLRAIDAGVTQVVNLGAGYDDRALRFRHDGLRFFEVDLPHVIEDKKQRVEATGADASRLTFVSADFSTDDVAELLEEAGHDATAPTLFIAEHVVLFVDSAAVGRLVAALARRATPGSTLGLTVEVHPDGLDSEVVVPTVDEVMFGGAGPLRAIRSRGSWIELLDTAGWRVEDVDDVTAIDHFQVPVGGEQAQIQTQFVTATSK